MSKHFSPTVFALVGAIGYVLAYTFNWPAFAYYPLIKQFNLTHDLPKVAGPAMLYYGWITTAAVAAVVLAFAVPKSLAAKLPPSLGWIVPALLLVYTAIYDRTWFL